ncbi:MAG: hypothetical protein ACPLRM_09445, partial [Anaerolineae bacterium]
GLSLRPMVAVLPPGQDPAELAVREGAAAIAQVAKRKISLLRYELEQALSKGDTSTAEGRVRLFDEVRRILAQATSLMEREEEIRFVADRLRLGDESVALLLREGRAAAPGPSAPRTAGRAKGAPLSLARRILQNETSVEREFLVACACNPERAGEILEALTPDHFVDPDNREVFLGLREVLSGKNVFADRRRTIDGLKERARREKYGAGSLFVRLVMEADQGRYSVAVLEELHLRLQEQYLKREIAALRAALDEGGDKTSEQRRLVTLERLLSDVRAGLMSIDPEQGHW